MNHEMNSDMTPDLAAEHAAARALLGCWLREVPGCTITEGYLGNVGHVEIPLPSIDARLLVTVRRSSQTSHHRLELPALLESEAGSRRVVDLPELAALLVDNLPLDGPVQGGSGSVLERVLDSTAAIADALRRRHDEVERLWSAAPLSFAESEQALLLGHPLHPTPKSRSEMPVAARSRYSPEVAGSFPLRWLAVRPGLVRHRSALPDDAVTLARRLLHDDPAVDDPDLSTALCDLGPRVLLPAHPYEADYLALSKDTADLFDRGDVVDLGERGSPYLPTTSVRTVYRAESPYQLKFSLHVRVTNSMRVTLPKELDRAVESAMLGRTAVARQIATAAPSLVLLQDPAYLTIDGHDGFSVLLRENRWTPGGPRDVSALTTLCQDHPYGGRNRLVAIVATIAARTGRSESDVAREWFARFCDVVVRALIRLYLDVGLCFEAHQQNTLVELENGWPVRGVYRDSQGYFHREAAHGDLTKVVPGLGEQSESIFPEALADERLVYYLFVNLTLGVIDALGEVADEAALLADLRELLEAERKAGGRYAATLLDRLLDDDVWPCKANLLTRAHDMDELIGDIAEQSVYVSIPNPVSRRGAVRVGAPDNAAQGVVRPDNGTQLPPPRDRAGLLGFTRVSSVTHAEQVHDWMNRPHVAPWWQLAVSLPEIRAYLDGLTHLNPWLATVDGVPFGYVETYRVAEDPLADYYDADESDLGWHVLVGPEEFLGTGVPRTLGRAVLESLLAAAPRVVCEPDVRNKRMHAFCRALGHEAHGEIELPDKRALLMVCTRESYSAKFRTGEQDGA